MSEIEAIVWVIGIITAGVTICSVAGSFSRAGRTIRAAQEEMKKEGNNVREDDSQSE